VSEGAPVANALNPDSVQKFRSGEDFCAIVSDGAGMEDAIGAPWTSSFNPEPKAQVQRLLQPSPPAWD
jgi:hypothetical protein